MVRREGSRSNYLIFFLPNFKWFPEKVLSDLSLNLTAMRLILCKMEEFNKSRLKYLTCTPQESWFKNAKFGFSAAKNIFKCPYFREELAGLAVDQSVLIFYVLIRGSREGVSVN